MDMYTFYRKSLDQQFEIVEKMGTRIAVRTETKQWVKLYYISNFFAELYYSRTSNKLILIRPFKNTDLLKPYLDRIDLPAAKLN